MTDFNTAYEKWLQIYQAERNFKLNHELLAETIENLAKQINVKFTTKDRQNLLNGNAPKGFYNKIYQHKVNKELYGRVVEDWYSFENARRDELYKQLGMAKNELFNFIGTISPVQFQSQNLSLFCTYDISPHNYNNAGTQAIYNRWLSQLYKHKFNVELRQASWHYGNKWEPIIVNTIFANINDKLKYVMCHPQKDWERLGITQENIKLAFYLPPNFGHQHYLFEPDYEPTAEMYDFKVVNL